MCKHFDEISFKNLLKKIISEQKSKIILEQMIVDIIIEGTRTSTDVHENINFFLLKKYVYEITYSPCKI